MMGGKKKSQKKNPQQFAGGSAEAGSTDDSAEVPTVLHALVSKKRSNAVIAVSAERMKDSDRDFGVLAGGFPTVLLNAHSMERLHIGLTDLVYVSNPSHPSSHVAVAVALPSQFTLRECL